ncbi:hypothetical protein MUG87_09770 [Ectobacillus sp. JY-23]|uniref:hypothetical protein n=1 Tax=Ectobacillus sp. JY-23 TaxID=2933872 RepID=UPI001FF68025|nr:hypothetical protein [Ectobacillus sp. JY-23]UOY94348.1 hypothetical protein MUG87_09770 [Ectobacillus sp. JY-23]
MLIQFSLLLTCTFIGIILLSGRFFYALELKRFTNKLLRMHCHSVLDLDFSFEQMVYFVSLPSNIPAICNADKADLVVEFDYTSLLFPSLAGIQIRVKTEQDNRLLAYLPIKDFRLPALDQLLERGKIDKEAYLKIARYKLMHKQTIMEILEEVHKQMTTNRSTISS